MISVLVIATDGVPVCMCMFVRSSMYVWTEPVVVISVLVIATDGVPVCMCMFVRSSLYVWTEPVVGRKS